MPVGVFVMCRFLRPVVPPRTTPGRRSYCRLFYQDLLAWQIRVGEHGDGLGKIGCGLLHSIRPSPTAANLDLHGIDSPAGPAAIGLNDIATGEKSLDLIVGCRGRGDCMALGCQCAENARGSGQGWI